MYIRPRRAYIRAERVTNSTVFHSNHTQSARGKHVVVRSLTTQGDKIKIFHTSNVNHKIGERQQGKLSTKRKLRLAATPVSR